eukprot:CAMPEP_0177372890 /NCGR_PEP_ID=MMETSP0368-20130122/43298_1 /TAXON_ID=447022 ORGANISM="Scrippsiella hangoei-like, Strain SHHI-4" /NCGR_SAMPLE_ID=MMETSP0368 /ASSEMBLY_ACC=CAM_ASM_000363 /LENGTH=111 /DNA_ID=CAMNT_0018836315 /DNA_START=379 /DNA_END=710 /DNA_ORIENTATION=-
MSKVCSWPFRWECSGRWKFLSHVFLGVLMSGKVPDWKPGVCGRKPSCQVTASVHAFGRPDAPNSSLCRVKQAMDGRVSAYGFFSKSGGRSILEELSGIASAKPSPRSTQFP